MLLRQKIIIILLLLALAGFTLTSTLIHLLTELWWFNSVNFESVFWTRITWQIALWVGAFTIYSSFLWFNYQLALRFTRHHYFRFLEGSPLQNHTQTVANLGTAIIIFLVALSAAGASMGFWETGLKFLNATNFQETDPIFNRDIGFYLFRLPFYEGLQTWVFSLLLFGLIIAIAVYILKGIFSLNFAQKNYRFIQQNEKQFHGQAKTHITLLLAAIAMTVAVYFWLKRYDLLYAADGVVWGAGYTDTHAQLFAYWVMGIGALVLGVILIFAIWLRRTMLPIYGIGLYLIALVLVNGILPVLQQQLIVEPNELDKELPYIKHNIEYTRQAYDLNLINVESYSVSEPLTPSVLDQAQETIQNIRLWDYRPLLSTYRQLQEIRPYYHFNDVDIDRYTLDGSYRQVMLSARELAYDQVPQRAQTWVNKHLKYTHGNGLVMSPVNLVTPDGLPVLFIKNIPPVSQIDLTVTEPDIYYGEQPDRYIFTGMSTKEFDYPQGNNNVFTLYDGEGGVPIDNFWRRLVYAYDLSSLKILISNYFTNNSRIHYYRNIRQRINQVAPFLRFDEDPYLVVVNGRLKWIIDAYTISDRFPYSEPLPSRSDQINYIRNAVKVLVDAKDGTMEFFMVDENEPVLATYRKIFPNLFSDTIPSEVKQHFRYPLDLYKAQAQMYLSYHMTNPQVFYNREDLWRFATENYEENQQLIEPYYQIMSLPGQTEEEFILILPFTPANKDNMIAWMAGRSDAENYGKLLLYEFPKQELIFGPFQIEARIDQNPEISQQLTLWSQEGSRVIRGNLLVIPLNGSLLYVEPVYLRAEQGQLPELKRVIVAYNKEAIMRPTLQQALSAIVGDEPTEPSTISPPLNSNLIDAAADAFQKAEEARKQGNWAEYGRYQQQLKEIFQQIENQ
jgi:uncharacterized membrane protein (UPF0182 family)